MNLRGRLGKNIVALSILQFMNYVVPIVTVPYLTRVLGPERFGLLAFAQAVIVYFDLITDYGFNLSATRTIATHRDDQEVLSRVFWSTVAAKVTLMLACGATLALLLQVVPMLRKDALLYEAAFLTVIGSALFPVWLFQGVEQMKFVTLSHSVARLLSIPALLLLVKQSGDYVLAAAVQGAVPIVAAIIIAPAVWKRIGIQPYLPSVSEALTLLRAGRHLFLSNTATCLYSSTTVLLLGVVAGNTQVGYYSAADKLIRAANSLVNPFTQALYPHLNSLRAVSEDAVLRLIRKSLFWIGLVTFLASAATFFLAPAAGRILLGSHFGPSVEVLRWMAPLLFIVGLQNVLGTQTMLVFGLDAQVSRIMLQCLLLNGFLTFILARSWGARGAVLATVASGLLMTVQMAMALRKAKLAVWSEHKEVACVP